jgi:diguanylate cyclase (GGDEF)-like protein
VGETTSFEPTELSPAWMARALGVLYGCGGSLALVWTWLPHRQEGGDPLVVAMALTAIVLGLVLVLGPTDRLPMWTFHLIIAVIQVVISVAYVAVGTPTNDIRLYYAWATPYAAFFFGRRAAVGHSVWTGACMVASLLLIGGSPAVSLRAGLMTMGAVVAVGSLVTIVAARMRAGRDLLHVAAMHDPLTGLANRRGFSASLDAALERRPGEGSVVVLLVDLDHFKLVNDTHGHHVGDEVLIAVAPRLVASVRAGDVVARMGGDEFAIVCEDHTGTLDLSALLARLDAVWAGPVVLEAGELSVSGSIGVVVCAGPEDTEESLLRDADIALYRAKADRRGSAVLYDPSLRAGLSRIAALDQALRGVLTRDELYVAFQPVVHLRTGRWVGAEALLRWTSPELGVVPPGDFIPVAEDRGQIGPIGDWAFDQACRHLADWRARGLVGPDFAVAVNVSGRQLRPGFAARVVATLGRHGLPPQAVHLEITESVLLDDSRATSDALAELRAIGAPMLLDDFGTGYSSLSYLQRLPLEGIKIDKSFVADINTSAPRRTLVSAMLAMAEGLGLDVVAEGVESQAVADGLLQLGCRRAQGYLWARPVSAAVFAEMLAASRVPADEPAYGGGVRPGVL